MALRPWESAAGLRVWERNGEFIYPRLATFYRLPSDAAGAAGFGAQPYREPQTANGASVFASTPIYTNVICSIQEQRQGPTPAIELPGSTHTIPYWRFFIPFSVLAKGSLLARDYVTDDLNVRYQITDPYWDSLGYRAYAWILET